jgi:uncharacterized protein YjcR
MGTSLISGYKNLINNIPKMIDISGYRNDYIAKKLGMKPQSFSVKKQRGNWTIDEVERILSIIDNEDVEDYCLGCMMEAMKDEPTITHEEFKKQMGWK